MKLRPRSRSLRGVVVLAGVLAGCGGAQAELGAGAEAAALERQVEGLRALVGEAEAGTLVPPGSLAVGIQEGVVRDLLNAGLPREFALEGGLRVRILSAEVSFRGTEGLVTLQGRVEREGRPSDFAEVSCSGGIATPRITGGRLSAPIALDRFVVQRVAASGRDNTWLRAAIDRISQQALTAVREGLPPLEIPVHLQEEVPIDGLSDGPVLTSAGRIPLSATVTRVVALQGRLWVLVHLSVGRFEARGGTP